MVLGIEAMGTTITFIFYAIAIVLWVAGGIGFKPGGERVQLTALGLAAFFFPNFWDALAAL